MEAITLRGLEPSFAFARILRSLLQRGMARRSRRSSCERRRVGFSAIPLKIPRSLLRGASLAEKLKRAAKKQR
jgi:hypothetical protein